MASSGSEAVCCICGADCTGTPPSAALGGRRICVLCSAKGVKPPKTSGGVPDVEDEGEIEIEGMSHVQLAALEEAQRHPPSAKKVAGPARESSPPAKPQKKAQCASCGADVTGVEDPRCPSCGELSRPRTSQGRIAAENRKEYAEDSRRRTKRALLLAAIGLVLLALIRGLQREPQLLLLDARYLGFGIPMAMVVYALCAAIFIGIDTPLPVQLARMAAILLLCHGVLAVLLALPASGCITLVVAPPVVFAIYFKFIKSELELDQMDAGLVSIISAGAMVGIIVASYWMV